MFTGSFILASILACTILLSARISVAASICLPCQVAYSTLWYPGLPRRMVYNPHITSPSARTKWKAGSSTTVTWDPSGIPAGTRCSVYLGYLKDGSPDEHLQINSPLAGAGVGNCDLSHGQVSVKVPEDTKPGNNYIVVVMGDSGNRSQKFTIHK